jgi:hypothetical protein
MRVEAPTPTMAPKAAPKFMNGKVIAKPEMANGPTPCPMKILSTILYKEEAVIAMMAGMAYCINSLPMGWVPSSVAFLFCDIMVVI